MGRQLPPQGEASGRREQRCRTYEISRPGPSWCVAGQPFDPPTRLPPPDGQGKEVIPQRTLRALP